MNQLGSLLNRWLKQSGYLKTVKQQQAIVYWRKIVGDYTADASRAVKIEGGVLWVKVKNSTWLHHLSMLKSQIMRNLEQYSGNNNIKDIYFFLGEIEPEEDIKEKEMEQERNKHNKNYEKKEQKEATSTEEGIHLQDEAGENRIDSGVIREWLSCLPEEDSDIKEKLERLFLIIYLKNGARDDLLY